MLRGAINCGYMPARAHADEQRRARRRPIAFIPKRKVLAGLERTGISRLRSSVFRTRSAEVLRAEYVSQKLAVSRIPIAIRPASATARSGADPLKDIFTPPLAFATVPCCVRDYGSQAPVALDQPIGEPHSNFAETGHSNFAGTTTCGVTGIMEHIATRRDLKHVAREGHAGHVKARRTAAHGDDGQEPAVHLGMHHAFRLVEGCRFSRPRSVSSGRCESRASRKSRRRRC